MSRFELPSTARVDQCATEPSILLAVTADESVLLMQGFPEYLSKRGWTVHLVSAGGPLSNRLAAVPGVHIHTIRMKRGMAPSADARALVAWIRLLRRLRPDLIFVGTPKAGLLGTLAGALHRLPNRIYLLRGLRSETMSGPSGLIARTMERVAVRCSHKVVCVSDGLLRKAIDARVLEATRGVVLGAGSSNGVRTDSQPLSHAVKIAGRRAYFERPEAFTLGFVGRVTRDKGLDTLAAALRLLKQTGSSGNLLMVGGDDCREAPVLRSALDASGWAVRHVGHVEATTPLMSVLDVLCLPSRREGFPNVVLEAAVLGVPCVGSDATGMRDAVVDGTTGLTFRTGDAAGLADAIRSLMNQRQRRERLGQSARVRAVQDFGRERVWAAQADFLEAVVGSRSLTTARGAAGA